jgi:hypothetical protein
VTGRMSDAENRSDTQSTHVNRDEIFQRFAHFEAFDVKVTGMDKVVDPCTTFMVSLSPFLLRNIPGKYCNGLTSD